MTVELVATLVVVFAIMLVEQRVSSRNERRLRAAGAVEAAGDVYKWMRVAYPATFVAMAFESVLRHVAGSEVPAGYTGRVAMVLAGIGVFALSKGLKAWAVASLGINWSFRVLVRPRSPLIMSGPYQYLRHPNYVAVMGELAGASLLLRAPVTGVLSLIVFAFLLRKRIVVEERALGLRSRR